MGRHRIVLPVAFALSGAFGASVATASRAGAQPRASRVEVRVENPIALERRDETIALSWTALRTRLPALAPGRARVLHAASGTEIAAQLLDADGAGGPDSLLFQASFWPSESKRFLIEAAPSALAHAPRVHVKYVDERSDIAWESDRIAWRTYGQKLWALENLHSSGIDVWVKRTRALVLDRWYSAGHDSYHADRGEGADFYKVGATLGGGGTAIWRNDRLYRAENFARHRIIADGPIRAIFELDFDPWDAGGLRVTETKRITIDAGSNLYKQESTYRVQGGATDPLAFAVGTVKRPGLVGSQSAARAWAWSSAWGPVEVKQGEGGHGDLGTAVLLEREALVETRELSDHYIAIATARPNVPAVSWVGAGWTGSRDLEGVEGWWAYLDAFAQRLESPLKIVIGGNR
jgi:pectinesterase